MSEVKTGLRALAEEMEERKRHCFEMFESCMAAGELDVAISWDRKAGEVDRWLPRINEILNGRDDENIKNQHGNSW